MSREFLLGMDVGGRGGRCLLIDTAGSCVFIAERRWQSSPVPGTGIMGFEFDTDRAWRLLAEATREVLGKAGVQPGQVIGVAAAGMRFSTVLLDEAGCELIALPNRDARAASEGMELAAEHGEMLNRRSGHWPMPIFTAARLLWLARTAPQLLARAATALTFSDWLAFRLCRRPGTDPSQAGGSLVFDVAERDWAWDLLEQFHLPRHLFPPLHTSGSVLGTLEAEAAEAMGLRSGIPVAVGGADTQCGLLGAGAVEPGQIAALAGSTTPLQLVLDEPLVDSAGRTWTEPHVVPGRWVLESNAGAMGEALEWTAGLLFPESLNPIARLSAAAGRSRPGANGITSTFGVQVMNGRRLSVPVGNITLSPFGTSASSEGGAEQRSNVSRAILEGTAFALKANAEQLRAICPTGQSELRLAGGMTRSALWSQIVCDTFGQAVSVSVAPEVSALGAAICAGVGAGVFHSLEEGAATFARQRRLAPDPERSAAYAGLYANWQRLRQAQSPADTLASDLAIDAVMDTDDSAATPGGRTVGLRVLATADLDEASLATLRELGDVTHAGYRQAMRLLAGPELAEALSGYNVFVTEVDVVDAEALRALPDLRVVASCRGTAVNVDTAACTALGIPVLYAPGRNAEAVADLAVGFMLALARQLIPADGFLRQPGGEAGDMGRMGHAHSLLQGRELGGLTVGLVGLGAVGRAVARRLRAFGCRVLAYDPYQSADDITQADAEAVSLDDLLAASDVVSLHAPVTDATRGMIGQAQLACMKPGAFLVNTARAALVDEAALADALRSKHLGGAALDVFAAEPPGADDPLLALPNVIATPHIGGNTHDVAGHQGQIIAEDLRRLAMGQAPRFVLNPEVLPGFSWQEARRPVDQATLDRLATQSTATFSDVQPAEARRAELAAPAPAAEPSASAPPLMPSPQDRAAPAPLRDQVAAVLRRFLDMAKQDTALLAFAAKHKVTTQYLLSDLGLEFYLGFAQGRVICDLGPSPETAEVRMKAKAEVLDSILTGRLSGNQAALTGKLSFTGDVRIAMGVQKIQADLVRLYTLARAEAGGLDLTGTAAQLPRPVAETGRAVPAPRPTAGTGEAAEAAGGLPLEITRTVNELYANGLITATGGNVSARIPESNDLYITPSQLFKGGLRPEMMVRVDLQGVAADPDAPAQSSEQQLHCQIYRARPDVQAIIHAHPPQATILMLGGLPFLPITTEAALLFDIPRVPFIMPGSSDLAAAVTKALGKGAAVFMQNHGIVAVGSSLRQAANVVEVIETTCQLIVGCYAAGKKPPTLPKDVVKTLQAIGRMVA